MAKTIGKEKATTRARTANPVAEPVGDRTNDEPRDEDMVEAEDDGDLALAVATKAPAALVDDDDDLDAAGGDDEAEDDEDTSLVLSSSAGALARGMPTPVTRRGFHTPGWMMNYGLTRLLAESIEELLKVTWPAWNEAWTMTIVVFVVSAVVAAILGVADIGLIRALSWIVNLGSGAPVTH